MIPRRLDRLPWSRRHTFVVVGLGIIWILWQETGGDGGLGNGRGLHQTRRERT